MQQYAWGPATWWSSTHVLQRGTNEVATLRRRAWWSGAWDLQVGPQAFVVQAHGAWRWRLVLKEPGGRHLAELRSSWSGLHEVLWHDRRRFAVRRPGFWSGAWRIEGPAGLVAELGAASLGGRRNVQAPKDMDVADLACLLALHTALLGHLRQTNPVVMAPGT
ncbi:MAG TPA: hypothetical protein VM286_03760 [Candidatus Thermoplasmatota archaeon]|nr:hypothetical protein [Candidatus Thermoplasmatota archaeon]